MKHTRLITIATLTLLSLASSVFAGEATAVRQRFVPTAPGDSPRNGASFSMLHHMPMNDPGVSMVMAHAGLGDSFPVQEEGGPKLFEVAVAGGGDDLLKLEVRRAGGVTKHDLPRDGTVWQQVEGHWFSISYPSVTVSSKDSQTTHQAMLMVHCFGK